MKKTLLITGWLWYIWSHGVVTFEQAWYKTIIVDNLSNSCLKTLRMISEIIWYTPKFYETDLRNKDGLEDIFKKNKIDWVIHFAWLKSPFESQEKPILYFQNNITWSLNLFELMKKYNVKNIVFSSSANIYSWDNVSPINEDWVLWPNNPYGNTKYILEQILLDLAKFCWFNVISLRYFNPIWAHKSWLIWEYLEWIPNNLLPYIMKVANGTLDKLKVFWNDYDTIDGTWVRDYIDVNDLIDGHLLAYNKIMEIIDYKDNDKLWYFDIYNLWIGKWVSVLEMIKASFEVCWKNIPYEIVPRRIWDLWEVYCDPSKAKKELWFEVKVSLKESLENSWRFYNK